MSDEGKTAMSILVNAMVNLRSVYDMDLKTLAEERNLGSAENLSGKENFVAADRCTAYEGLGRRFMQSMMCLARTT